MKHMDGRTQYLHDALIILILYKEHKFHTFTIQLIPSFQNVSERGHSFIRVCRDRYHIRDCW